MSWPMPGPMDGESLAALVNAWRLEMDAFEQETAYPTTDEWFAN